MFRDGTKQARSILGDPLAYEAERGEILVDLSIFLVLQSVTRSTRTRCESCISACCRGGSGAAIVGIATYSLGLLLDWIAHWREAGTIFGRLLLLAHVSCVCGGACNVSVFRVGR